MLIRELLYADDAAIIAHSQEELQDMCNAFAAACPEFGMTISIRKTVVMGLNTPIPSSVSVHNTPLDTVQKFCYLGSTMSATNSLDDELDTRIGKAATVFGRMRKRVWDNKDIPVALKMKVYEACVVSTLLYSAEGWTTYRPQEKWLNAFHMRNLRSILGIKWQDHIQNTVILDTTKCLDMRSYLQKRRLRWTGHVTRMDDARIPNQILFGELPNAPRPAGRPKLRYKDVVKRDLDSFGINRADWEKVVADRPEWRGVLHNGCLHAHNQYRQHCEARRSSRQSRADRHCWRKRPTTTIILTSKTTLWQVMMNVIHHEQ